MSGLPSGLNGIAAANSTDLGAWCAPLCSFTKAITINLSYLPGAVIATCAKPGITVRIAGRAAALDREVSIPFGDTTSTRQRVEVEFIGEAIDKQTVDVTPKQTTEVKCAL